jgi:hypothetical protein
MAMFPGLDQAMAKMKTQSTTIQGTAIQTVMTVDSVPSKEQMAQQQKQQQEEENSGGGGLLGGFAKRLGRKKSDDQQQGDSGKTDALMTMRVEILKLATTVAPEDVDLPAGLKLKN